MRTTEIAEKHGVSRFFVRMVERRDRKTTNISLARDIARKNKTAPIGYISPKIQAVLEKRLLAVFLRKL